jgi:hypothetical protein
MAADAALITGLPEGASGGCIPLIRQRRANDNRRVRDGPISICRCRAAREIFSGVTLPVRLPSAKMPLTPFHMPLGNVLRRQASDGPIMPLDRDCLPQLGDVQQPRQTNFSIEGETSRTLAPYCAAIIPARRLVPIARAATEPARRLLSTVVAPPNVPHAKPSAA